MWTSKEDFEKTLRDSYVSCELPADSIPIGRAFWQLRDEKGHEGVASTEIGLGVFDCLLSDAILWHFFFCLELSQAQQRFAFKAVQQTLWSLFSKLLQDSIVIRDLICAGYDLPARNLLRSADEYADAIYFLPSHPSLCEKFVTCRDEESSYEFWRRHLTAGKPKKFLETKIKELLNEPDVEFTAYRNEERKHLSTTHHPSFPAGFGHLFTPTKEDNVHHVYFGKRTEFSFRTSRMLFSILAETAMIVPTMHPELMELLLESKLPNSSDNFVWNGRRHLVNMYLELIRNWEAPIFGMSPELQAILKDISS